MLSFIFCLRIQWNLPVTSKPDELMEIYLCLIVTWFFTFYWTFWICYISVVNPWICYFSNLVVIGLCILKEKWLKILFKLSHVITSDFEQVHCCKMRVCWLCRLHCCLKEAIPILCNAVHFPDIAGEKIW